VTDVRQWGPGTAPAGSLGDFVPHKLKHSVKLVWAYCFNVFL